jgi:hypothetical protein
MIQPDTDSSAPLPVKLERIVPRILRPKGWRREKFSAVRFDQTRQRFDRINAHYLAYKETFDGNGDCFEAFREKRKEILEILSGINCPTRPINFWSRKAWVAYRKALGIFENAAKKLSCCVHDLHVLFVKSAPFHLMESGIDLGLFDLKIISSPELYEKARRGLECYDSGWSPPHTIEKTYATEEEIRGRCIILVQETRRQSLALAQLEVLRDAVTMELIVAATRLSIIVGLILLITRFIHIDSVSFSIVSAALLCAQGGIIGSVISSIIRIGKMQENLDVSRALTLISGASRSIYHVPLIGCLVALVLFAAAAAEVKLGVIDLDLFGDENESIYNISSPLKLLLRSFVLGIACGFSERLVHDLVDRFNKKPTK